MGGGLRKPLRGTIAAGADHSDEGSAHAPSGGGKRGLYHPSADTQSTDEELDAEEERQAQMCESCGAISNGDPLSHFLPMTETQRMQRSRKQRWRTW